MAGSGKGNKILIRRKPDNSIQSSRLSKSFLTGKFAEHNKLVALIPVFNAERWLEFTLRKLSRDVDAIIALDDGSSDRTLDILKSFPKVIEIIIKPTKPLIEWNDAQNRYELYLAAEKYQPEWVLCMDADEYFDDKFSLLREDLNHIPEDVKALAFHFDDIDQDTIIREKYRHKLYRYKRHYTFDNKRLHCRLIPLEIAIDEVKLVNIRLFHIADIETRRIRFEKYLEADPTLYYQSSYKHLLRKAVRKDLVPLGSELLYTNVVEDGLQRMLKVRRIRQYEKDFISLQQPHEISSQILQHSLQIDLARQHYNHIIMDAFLIRFEKKKGLIAEYSYDSTRDVHVSKVEAWLIEELHHHRDFDLTFKKFFFLKNCKLIDDCALSFLELIHILQKKKILKLIEPPGSNIF